MGGWKAALSASAVLAAGAGVLASPAAGATAPPVERASATAVAILTPSGHETSGTPTVFAWETPVSGRGYRFPDDGSLVRIGHVAASAERGSGDAIAANGAVVLRSVELFGGLLRVDVVRADASLVASDGAITDTSASHLVHVRLNGDPIKLVPGKKVWVKGWGYAVVDDPVARSDSTSGGDTLAGLRLHLTSAHAGTPGAGQTSSSARSTPTSGTSRPRPPADPGGSGGSGSTGTLPDRQAKRTAKRHRRGAPAPHARQGSPAPRHHRHPPPPPAPVKHPVDAAASGRPRQRSARRARAGGSGPGRLAVRLGRREPDRGRVRLLRASLTMPMPGPGYQLPGPPDGGRPVGDVRPARAGRPAARRPGVPRRALGARPPRRAVRGRRLGDRCAAPRRARSRSSR